MKAAVYKTYGPPEVVGVLELNKPRPMANEMLIKIHAATVTSGDVRLRSSDFPPLFWLPARLMFGLFRPKKKILGHEFSGVVEALGKNVNRFSIGDRVFGTTTMLKTGSHAEFIAVPQEWKHGVVELMPNNMSFKEAAALPVGSMTAMFLLKKANLKSGQNVLIYGASGSVGSYAVQLANVKGANVTGVCSESNFEMVKSLGAKTLIDYQKEDFSSSNIKYDIVFDAVGKISKSKAKKVLNSNGEFVTINTFTKESAYNLKQIKEMAEKGELRPFIDKYFSLHEIKRAHEYVDTGRKKGNIVVEIFK